MPNPPRLVHPDADALLVPAVGVQAFALCDDGITSQLLVALADGKTWCCSVRPGLPVEVGTVQ